MSPTARSRLVALYATMKIRPDWQAKADRQTNRIIEYQSRYRAVQEVDGVPWYVVGIIHGLEGNFDFNTHLHNGDSLKYRTIHIPRGRPVDGHPPFSWHESAVDALRHETWDTFPRAFWRHLGFVLDRLERYNGLGYRSRGVPSPYLWSGSNHYVAGKFVSDGVYSPTAISEQVGAAVLLKTLETRGVIVELVQE